MSITVCPRLEVLSKKGRWQISYICCSVSTILSTLPSMGMMPGVGQMAGGIAMGAMMPAGSMGVRPAMGTPIGQMMMAAGIPGAAGQRPAGTMMAGPLTAGQRPAGIPAMGTMISAPGTAGAPAMGAMPAVPGTAGQRPAGAPAMGVMPAAPAIMGQMPSGVPTIGAMGQRPVGAPMGAMPGAGTMVGMPGAPQRPAGAPAGIMTPVMMSNIPQTSPIGQRPPGASAIVPARSASRLINNDESLPRTMSIDETMLISDIAKSTEDVTKTVAIFNDDTIISTDQELITEGSHDIEQTIAISKTPETNSASSYVSALFAESSENIERMILSDTETSSITSLGLSDNVEQTEESEINLGNYGSIMYENEANLSDYESMTNDNSESINMVKSIATPENNESSTNHDEKLEELYAADSITTSEVNENSRVLKRRKRNYDIFDFFHQSDRCVRAYRICITKSRHYIVSRLGNARKTGHKTKHNECIDKPARIVYGPMENLCPNQYHNTLHTTTLLEEVTKSPNDPITQNYDSLDAIVVHDESIEVSDYYPQNLSEFIPSNQHRPEIFPNRTPPIFDIQIKEASKIIDDSLIFKENLTGHNEYTNDELGILAN